MDGRYESDESAELDRRIYTGGGLGYRWYNTAFFDFSTEVGVGSLYERYNTENDATTEAVVQLGYRLRSDVTDQLKLMNDLTYFPEFGQPSDYFLTSTAEVRWMLSDKFFTNFKAIFDYDTTPADNSGKTDVKYMLGVGYNF